MGYGRGGAAARKEAEEHQPPRDAVDGRRNPSSLTYLLCRGGYRPLFFGLGSGRVLDLRARVGSGLKVRVLVGPSFFGFQALSLKLVHFF